VKELRLEGISSIEAANAFMPRFINDFNKRFSKEPRNTHNAHRAVRPDEDLGSIFSWRELRKVTKALTLHYERKLYMLADTAINRGFIGKYLEFFQYPDGRIEIRAGGVSLPYSMYDKFGRHGPGCDRRQQALEPRAAPGSAVQARQPCCGRTFDSSSCRRTDHSATQARRHQDPTRTVT
jgi:hypothetical protein